MSGSLVDVEDDGSLLVISRYSDGSLEEPEPPTITPGLNSFAVESEICQAAEENADAHHTETEVSNDGEDETLSQDSQSDSWNQCLTKELQNLAMIKKVNSTLMTMLSTYTTMTVPSKKKTESSTQTEEIITHDLSDVSKPLAENLVKMNNTPWYKLSSIRRRRNFRQTQHTDERPNIQAFIQDYYRSLNVISRYMIAASVIGFLVAFITLTLYGSQLHQNDMELFKLKEKQFLTQQTIFEKSQQQHENFRETLIHQRFEETRECHSTLKLYLSDRDELIAQISNMEKEAELTKAKLETNLDNQRMEILELESKLGVLREENKRLKMENVQSFSSAYTQILFGMLNILKNNSMQIVVGAVVALFSIFIFVANAGGFGKLV